MSNFLDTNCPICDKRFTEDDNIVVCPKCGAPYHRDCYMEQGECKFHELHEQGKAWEPPVAPELKTASSAEIKDQECKKCGVLNARSSLFCSNCGNALKIEPQTHNNFHHQQNTANNNYRPPVYRGPMGAVPPIFDPMGGVTPSDVMDENISYADASKVVQQANNYYLPAFKQISAIKKSKFNLSAFVFSGGWLIYRKQYKPGVIITALMLLLYLAQTFVYYYVYAPILTTGFSQLGIVIDDSGVTFDQMVELMPYLTDIQMFLLCLPSVITGLMFAIMLFMGFKGNKLYYKHTIKVINKARGTTQNADDFNNVINEKGGVNTMASVCVLICYLLCSYLPLFFLI